MYCSVLAVANTEQYICDDLLAARAARLGAGRELRRRRARPQLGLQLLELGVELVRLLELLEAIVHRVVVQLGRGLRARFLSADLVLHALETARDARSVDARHRVVDLALGSGPSAARDEQVLLGARFLHL